jgi:putative ABC transport system permease protein
MHGYYFRLALHNLRRNPWLTALIVVAVALGIGSSMTVYSILRAMASDPIPHKSARLFTPQIDNFGPDNRRNGEPPDMLTYKDVVAFRNAKLGLRQAGMFEIAVSASAQDSRAAPVLAQGRATHGDFFTMFDVPFRSGAAWTPADDEARATVAVITTELADRLFPGIDPVGRILRLEARDYRVVGVTQSWTPSPRFYDLSWGEGRGYDPAAEVFVPFETAIAQEISSSGALTCLAYPGLTRAEFLASDCIWAQFWVELPDAASIRRFRDFLNGYAAEQQRAGRFSWAPFTRLRNVTEWLAYKKVVPNEVRLATLVAFGFLLVCLVNAAALMLARASRRSAELNLRRALGASRTALLTQGLWESLAIGLVGALAGLGLTVLGLHVLRNMVPEAIVRTTDVAPSIVALTILAGTVATVCAGMYPAWRSSRLAGALQLKTL